ncbi:hypothetical protein Q669_28560 [Labrenzia sp. C1B10]|nr:hypothetical protein Q669_28560 [Labrenzia sp. C1B10]ERS06447.1 hypothetical protein Q675_27030 [Labrenzia sp. C1B70]
MGFTIGKDSYSKVFGTNFGRGFGNINASQSKEEERNWVIT